MIFRKFKETDKETIKEMMKVFYASPAVSTNGSNEIFETDIAACLDKNSILEGFAFEEGGEIIGYGMTYKGFSTEVGKECVWVEDLYIKEEWRHKGIGGKFLEYLKETYKGLILKLEVETENEAALSVYKKHGFKLLPYHVMRT